MNNLGPVKAGDIVSVEYDDGSNDNAIESMDWTIYKVPNNVVKGWVNGDLRLDLTSASPNKTGKPNGTGYLYGTPVNPSTWAGVPLPSSFNITCRKGDEIVIENKNGLCHTEYAQYDGVFPLPYDTSKAWVNGMMKFDVTIVPSHFTGTLTVDKIAADLLLAKSELRSGVQSCNHEYINVGFTSVIEVCKKCNKDKVGA